MAADLETATADLLERLGYGVTTVATRGTTSLLRATWARPGYGREFADQGRHLGAALRTAGIEARIVDGPIVGTEPLHEWRLIASDPADAERVSLWLVRIGRATGRVSASTAAAAHDHVLAEWGTPPSPWRLAPVTPPGTSSVATLVKKGGVTDEALRLIVVTVSTIVGAAIAAVQRWKLSVSGTTTDVAAKGSDIVDWQSFALAQAQAVVIVVVLLGALWGSGRPLAPTRPWATVTASKRHGRWAKVSRVLSPLLAAVVITGLMAFVTAVIAGIPLQALAAGIVFAGIAVAIRAVEPHDRPAVKVSVSAVLAILLGLGWAALPDSLASSGLGLPAGSVQADGFTRGLVLAVVLVCPSALLLAGMTGLRNWRRRSHVEAALLVFMVFLGVTLSASVGLTFAMAQAGQPRRDPQAGIYAGAVTLQRVRPVTGDGVASPPPTPESSLPAPSGDLYALVGRAGSHLVVIPDPCRDEAASARTPERDVRLVPAGGVQLEPLPGNVCAQP